MEHSQTYNGRTGHSCERDKCTLSDKRKAEETGREFRPKQAPSQYPPVKTSRGTDGITYQAIGGTKGQRRIAIRMARQRVSAASGDVQAA